VDRYSKLRSDLKHAVLEQPASLDAPVRAAAASERFVPEALVAYVAKIHRHAYRVEDADIAGLKAAGYTEDQIFEATLSAALGAGTKRLEAALAVLGGGGRDATR